MYTLNQLLTLAVVMASIGLIAGLIISNYLNARKGQGQRLQDRLRKTEEELTHFRSQVTQHFNQTAGLMNNLNNSYRDIHDHLTMDAMRLSNVDISRDLILQPGHSLQGSIKQQFVEPPLDYAPRHPNKPGTLSEEYRLQEDVGNSQSFPII